MPDHFEERLDGDLIARPTRESLRAGVGADKPLVMGTTDDEFSMAMADAAKALRWVPRGLLLGKFGFAEHCLDVPFFFDCLDGPVMEPLAGPNPPQALADEVHAAAVAFITGGDPGWPRHDDRGIVRVFADRARICRTATPPSGPCCERRPCFLSTRQTVTSTPAGMELP